MDFSAEVVRPALVAVLLREGVFSTATASSRSGNGLVRSMGHDPSAGPQPGSVPPLKAGRRSGLPLRQPSCPTPTDQMPRPCVAAYRVLPFGLSLSWSTAVAGSVPTRCQLVRCGAR